jgi:putative NADH-flavin reductase
MPALIASNKFNVSVLSRDPTKATFPSSVIVIAASYDDVTSLAKVLEGQDAVVCALADDTFDQQMNLINASIKAGVKRYFPSEWGSNSLEPKSRGLMDVFDQKYKIIDYLKEKQGNGFSWTGITVGAFYDW